MKKQIILALALIAACSGGSQPLSDAGKRGDFINGNGVFSSSSAPKAGPGINVSGATVSINDSYTQRRVAQTCGTAISQINQDGTVGCSAAGGTGTVTSVTSTGGDGITVANPSTTPVLSVDNTILQSRVSGTCTSPNAIASIAVGGTVTCTTGVLNTTNVSGTTTDLAVFTGANTVGNFAGSSPSACTTGQALTNESIDATGALTNTCTTLISGTNNTLTKFTGANTIGNASPTDDGTTLTVVNALAASNTITPTDTGTLNDYAPTGIGTAAVIRWNGAGTATINGITTGVAGRFLVIDNISTSTLTLATEAAGSTAANRILGPANSNVSLSAGASNSHASALLQYDGTSSRWRVISYNSSTIAQPLTTSGALTVTNGMTISTGSFTMSSAGHAAFTGTAPSITSCGSTPSPSITGSDMAGRFTTGGTATSCTITFQATFTNPPSCIIHTEGSATQPTYTTSATAITITVDIATTTYDYICFKVS